MTTRDPVEPSAADAGNAGNAGNAADAPDAAGAPDSPIPESGAARAFRAAGRGALIAGAAVARATVAAGRAVARGYLAVDPDVRKHIAQLPLLGLTLLAPGGGTVVRLRDDGHRPVVFVHGLGGGGSNFFPLRAWLRTLGRSRMYAVMFAGDGTMEEMTERLVAFIDEVVRVNELGDDGQVDVVAHSMGGLVSRLALDDPRIRARVSTLVTLGTPHSGTHLARLADTAHTRALRPDSHVVERLRQQLPWSGGVSRPALVSLWSRADMLLLPPESACVEGATNIEMEGFTHYSYLIHPDGWRTVARAIQ